MAQRHLFVVLDALLAKATQGISLRDNGVLAVKPQVNVWESPGGESHFIAKLEYKSKKLSINPRSSPNQSPAFHQ